MKGGGGGLGASRLYALYKFCRGGGIDCARVGITRLFLVGNKFITILGLS